MLNTVSVEPAALIEQSFPDLVRAGDLLLSASLDIAYSEGADRDGYYITPSPLLALTKAEQAVAILRKHLETHN